MQFSSQEIHDAKELRNLSLRWEPQPGHYVWDETGLIEQPSPFQDGVYFILDLKHFLRRTGSLDRLKQSMVWLPTWHEARHILQTMGIDHSTISEALLAPSVLEHHRELRVLYELMAAHLRTMPHTKA